MASSACSTVLMRLVSYRTNGSMPIFTPTSPAYSATGARFSRSSAYSLTRSSGVIRHVRPVEV